MRIVREKVRKCHTYITVASKEASYKVKHQLSAQLRILGVGLDLEGLILCTLVAARSLYEFKTTKTSAPHTDRRSTDERGVIVAATTWIGGEKLSLNEIKLPNWTGASEGSEVACSDSERLTCFSALAMNRQECSPLTRKLKWVLWALLETR